MPIDRKITIRHQRFRFNKLFAALGLGVAVLSGCFVLTGRWWINPHFIWTVRFISPIIAKYQIWDTRLASQGRPLSLCLSRQVLACKITHHHFRQLQLQHTTRAGPGLSLQTWENWDPWFLDTNAYWMFTRIVSLLINSPLYFIDESI